MLPLEQLAWNWHLLVSFFACCGIYVAQVFVTIVGLVQRNFLCPHGQRFIAIIFACFFTGAHSFTVLSVPGVLLGFGVFQCFLPPSSPLVIVIFIYQMNILLFYQYHYFVVVLLFSFLCICIIIIIIFSFEFLACDR